MSTVSPAATNTVIVEDLIQGLNEWRNIQDIVRLTFKAFHDVLKAQGDAIKTLEKAVEGKVGRGELNAALQNKASTMDTNAKLLELSVALGQKMDQMEGVVEDISIHRSEQERTIRELRAELSAKAETDDVMARLEAKASIVEVGRAMDGKVDGAEVERRLNQKLQAMGQELAGKAGKADMELAVAGLREEVAESSSEAVRLASSSERRAVEEVRAAAASREAGLEGLRRGTEAVELRVAQLEGVTESMAIKVDDGELRRCLDLKADISQVNEALSHKANIMAVNSALERLEQMCREGVSREELADKVEARDMCALLDVKANVEDVNAALLEINREMEAKAPLEQLRRSVREQSIINASLCTDSSVGRWIWKSGRAKAGGGVPWNVQSVNTDPDNFFWERDKVNIVTTTPGLYEVTFGFFTRKKPSVQLLINGEPVLAAVNSASYVVHHSSGRLTSVGRHPAGNVTGLTMVDFLALPPKARVALTYSGEEGGEGFLGLRKL
mmetsp:Transcript_29692/g.95427  ORF Transcript_29692/g.95427 Transcript_29692/m.95427 type:complete len:501 (+) Transcript_29692:516-2018(+)